MNTKQTELSTNSIFNLPETYTETNYLEAGKRLAKAGQFLNWQIGRWYNSLEWGDKRDICTKVGLNYVSAKDCGSIEKKIKMSMRNDNLTFQHHKVIAIEALDDEQRTELLQQAEYKKLSSKQLTTARDILLGRDTVKPVIDVQPEQIIDSATHEDHNLLVGDVRNEPPAAYGDTRQPEQSYNAAFEANKELSGLKQANEKLRIKNDELSTKTVTQGNEIRTLESQVMKLKSDALIDEATIDRLRLELEKPATNTAIKPKPAKAVSGTNSYDGNAKGFKAVLVSILGGDNNVVSAERKKAYAALNISPKANGQLKSDTDRLAVYEWLVATL